VKKTIAILAAAAGSLALLATFAQAEPTSTSAKAGPTSTSAKMTICHRTKSAPHPYRRITVAGASLAAHQRHGADIIPAPPGGCPSSVMTARRGGRPLSTTMTGAAERPGPGDPDGTGTAVLRIKAGQRQVCYTLTAENIEPATAAHIHRVSTNAVVVPLTTPTTGTSSGCDSVEKALLQEIVKSPNAFYVNVHTATWANGQVQGKLSR